MKYMLIALGLLFSGGIAKAADLYVVDVRRNITLSEDDPVYKDFYIKNTPDSGFKKNMVVTAVRKINVRDASGASAVGEIQVPVGQLRIIAIYEKVAVAREHTLLSRDELPMLEQIGIMTGDKIETQGAFQYTPKKTSQVSPKTSASPVVSANSGNIKPKEQGLPQSGAETALNTGEILDKVAKSSY